MKNLKSSCCQSSYCEDPYPQYWREDNYLCSSCKKNCTIEEIEDNIPSPKIIFSVLSSFVVVPLSLATFLHNTTLGVITLLVWLLSLIILNINLNK